MEAMLRDGTPDDLYAEAICVVTAPEMFGCCNSMPIGKLSERQMRAISEYIDVSYGRSITISDLTKVVGLGRFHFARLLKNATGRSPYQFVTAIRMDRAATMLATSQLSVEAIASTVGFNSASQFGRAFRKIVGQSPQVFRRSSYG
jgi:AraC family transcriptional regulator